MFDYNIYFDIIKCMEWTREQQSVIDIREKNILVSAAAGSGKTAVLVERIKDLIIKDRVPLKSMLIVTFTNAAAGEMRQRITDALSKELELNGDIFIQDQLQNIYNTHISTFHAFAISILKRYYHMVGIEPSFNICPENQLDVYKNEALDILLAECFNNQNSDFLYFMKNYASSKNEDSVRAMILETYDFIQTVPDSNKWLLQSVEDLNKTVEDFMDSFVFKTIKDQIDYDLKRGLGKNRALIEDLNENGIDSLVTKAESDSSGIESLIHTLENERFEIFLDNIKEYKFQRFAVSKDEKDDYEVIKEAINKKRDSIKKDINYTKVLFPDWTVESRVNEIRETYSSARILAMLVLEFSKIFSNIKKKEDMLDFNDVEHLALKILNDNQVAREYKDKFQYIYIDEYQDSNYIQEALIERIKRDDNLFMVGDVKQSIYKFRRAEPSIFLDRYQEYESVNSLKSVKIDLNNNFRSKKNVIDCINDTFVHIMEKNLSGIDYDEKAFLYKGLNYDGQWDIPVDFFILDSGKLVDEESNDAVNEILEVELEAHKIAGIIKNQINTPIYDVKQGRVRDLQYRDIAILLRAVKGNASVIYRVLMDHGIPTFADGGEDYFSTVEIETFLNLLKVIDNRRQDVPLVSAMYSPVFGFTTEELIKIRLIKKTGNYYSSFLTYLKDGPDEELRKKCVETDKRIDKWKRDESFMSLDDFLWMLMKDSGYYNYTGALIGGVQRRANLRALIDRASDYSQGRIRGLFGFINYIDTINKNDIKMGQIKLLSENDNVVRITSVHKSKGLEYPYVILARLGKSFNKNSSNSKVRLNKDLGLALQWENYSLHAFKKTILMQAIKENTDIEELAEEIRVLYVAMTRAMDKLTLIGSINSKDKDIEDILTDYKDMDTDRDLDIKAASSYLNLLLPVAYKMGMTPEVVTRENIANALDTENEIESVREEILERIESIKISTGDFDDSDNMKNEIMRRLDFEYSHKNSLTLKSKYSVTQLNEIGKEPEKIMTYGLGEDRMSELTPEFLMDDIPLNASERGTVLHTVCEKLDFKDALKHKGDPDYINDFLDSLYINEILTEEERNSVNAYVVSKFINSGIMKRAAASNNIRKERPFNLIKEIDGEKVMIQGIIDCFFDEKDGLILVDYKSNYVDKDNDEDKARIAAMYSEQINLYREALETITKKKVKEAYLYLTGIGDTIEIARNERVYSG